MNKNVETIRKACIKANPTINGVCAVHEYHHDDCMNCAVNGRPIRLADVLLAIQASAANWNIEALGCSVELEENSKYLELNINEGRLTVASWNLLKDDFREQSEETLAFLAELLK